MSEIVFPSLPNDAKSSSTVLNYVDTDEQCGMVGLRIVINFHRSSLSALRNLVIPFGMAPTDISTDRQTRYSLLVGSEYIYTSHDNVRVSFRSTRNAGPTLREDTEFYRHAEDRYLPGALKAPACVLY